MTDPILFVGVSPVCLGREEPYALISRSSSMLTRVARSSAGEIPLLSWQVIQECRAGVTSYFNVYHRSASLNDLDRTCGEGPRLSISLFPSDGVAGRAFVPYNPGSVTTVTR